MKPKFTPKKTKSDALPPSRAKDYLQPKIKTRQRVYTMIKQGKFPNAYVNESGLLMIPISDLDAENKRRKENPWLQ
jgi:hypothetical protein